MLRNSLILAVVVVFTSLSNSISAGPLTSAEVTKIINRVSVVDPQIGERPALLRDVIKDDLGVATGRKSRSELLFQDDTLTRLGAETFFSFKTGTRDLTLEKGSMLLQVPKGLGGARIHTGAVTAAITGTTIMIDYLPKQYLKVLVLEGSLRVSRNGMLGDSVLLRPGKMLIMKPGAKKIPEPVDVDLAHIVKTSPLVNFPGADPLPSTDLIQSAIADQQKDIASNKLAPTNVIVTHGGTAIVDPIALGNQKLLPGATVGAVVAVAKNDVGAVTPVVGKVVSTATTLVGGASSNVTGLLNSTTGTVGTVANDLLGNNSVLTPVTSTVNNVVSPVTSILPPVATVVDTLLSAPTTTATSPVVVPVVPTLTNAVAPTVTTLTNTTSSTLGALRLGH